MKNNNNDNISNTPGSQALLNFKNSVAEFKKPVSVSAKKKPKILTEEKYVEELAKIIQRDFFPDLEKLRAQNEYLDAVDRKDYEKIAELHSKYSGRKQTERKRPAEMSPPTFETPAISSINNSPTNGFDTPKSTLPFDAESNADDEEELKKTTIADGHSLDSFLHAYTSEDNHSFQEIIDTAEQKLKEKFALLYNHEKVSAERLANILALPTIENQFKAIDPARKIETWTYKNKNSIMFLPDGVELTENERIEAVNFRQTIKHNATRLTVNPFLETLNDETTEKNDELNCSNKQDNFHKALIGYEKVGTDGKIIVKNTNVATTPNIRGFSFMKTPSPRPGEEFSPLITWGEMEGTPFRLDGSDTPMRCNSTPAFKINETSRRETIALALADKVGEKMRAQKQHAAQAARKNISSPFIRTNMDRLASMSPAAKRLATTKVGLRTPRMTPRLTPTPLSTPLLSKRRINTNTNTNSNDKNNIDSKNVVTPTQYNGNIESLTDDLLKIPTKRLKASDFF